MFGDGSFIFQSPMKMVMNWGWCKWHSVKPTLEIKTCNFNVKGIVRQQILKLMACVEMSFFFGTYSYEVKDIWVLRCFNKCNDGFIFMAGRLMVTHVRPVTDSGFYPIAMRWTCSEPVSHFLCHRCLWHPVNCAINDNCPWREGSCYKKYRCMFPFVLPRSLARFGEKEHITRSGPTNLRHAS